MKAVGENMDMTPRRNRPYLLMGILMVFWGSYAAVSKLALTRMDLPRTLFWFFGLAWAAMAIWLLCKGKLPALRALGLRGWLRRAPAALAQWLYYLLYGLAMLRIPTAEAATLNYLFPVFLVVLAIPLKKEPLNGHKAMAIGLGLLGALLIITGGSAGLSFTNLIGDLLAVGAAVCWALFSILGSRNTGERGMDSFVDTTIALALSALLLPLSGGCMPPDMDALLSVGWMTVSNLLMTYLLWFRVLRIASAAQAASLAYFTPFVTLIFIAVLLGEPIAPRQLAGLAVLTLGVLQQSALLRQARSLWNRKRGISG